MVSVTLRSLTRPQACPSRPARAAPRDGRAVVNPEHVVTLQPIRSETGATVVLDVEVKLTGMNLIRVRVGTFQTAEDADAAWRAFLAALDRDAQEPAT